MHTLPPTDPATPSRRRKTGRPSPNGDNGDRRETPAAPSPDGDNGGAAEKPAPPSPNGANGRDARGRFTKGNPGGPGNPFARRLGALRRALCETVTEDDVQAIVRQLLQRARDGDVAAIKVLFAYVIGRPTDAVDPDRLDAREWEMYRDYAARGDDLTGLVATIPTEMACVLARAIMPKIGETFARNFVAGVRAQEAEEAEDEDDETEDDEP
jgi:hypothetical protein